MASARRFLNAEMEIPMGRHDGVPIFFYSPHAPHIDISGWPLVTYLRRRNVHHARQGSCGREGRPGARRRRHSTRTRGRHPRRNGTACGPGAARARPTFFRPSRPAAHRTRARPNPRGRAGRHPPALPHTPPAGLIGSPEPLFVDRLGDCQRAHQWLRDPTTSCRLLRWLAVFSASSSRLR
jgi:hypothetical protein